MIVSFDIPPNYDHNTVVNDMINAMFSFLLLSTKPNLFSLSMSSVGCTISFDVATGILSFI